MIQRCVNCRFWTLEMLHVSLEEDPQAGECRVNPPSLPNLDVLRFLEELPTDAEERIHLYLGEWPVTYGTTGWCGRWEGKR